MADESSSKPPSPKPDVELMQRIVGEPMSPGDRRILHDVKVDIARLMASRNLEPNLAMTALLNLMGSLLGTQYDAKDRAAWIAQVQAQLPLYVEAYRSREKRIM